MLIKIYQYTKIAIIVVLIFALLPPITYHLQPSAAEAAQPSSTNFTLQSYGFGGGGIASASSTNYSLNGIAGEVEFGRLSSSNFKAGSGLTYLMKANVPEAPTFTNPSSNYDRLKFVINQSGNPSDTTYALQISTTSDFSSNVSYIKSDNTLGSTLTVSDYKTYANWGGASGGYVTGLVQNTTYYLRVKAERGYFTESEYGPSASATTSTPSLTFGIDSATLTFDNLNAANSYTDSSKTTVLTTSTNAYNGYVVNARETAALTAAVGTIADYTSPNSAPTTWSGTGFGYTTDDSDLTGGTANRFTSGGAKYAGFTTSSPGDPVADHAGPVLTAISNEQFTVSYRVTVSETQKAANYTTTVLYMVVPSY
jgi:hypothetical protein